MRGKTAFVVSLIKVIAGSIVLAGLMVFLTWWSIDVCFNAMLVFWGDRSMFYMLWGLIAASGGYIYFGFLSIYMPFAWFKREYRLYQEMQDRYFAW